MDWAMDIADWKGFAQRKREAAEARQAARPRPRQLRRVLDRRAEGAGAHHGAARRPRRCRDRHAAERAGPRDELRAGGLRPDRRAGREGEDHPRRHRRGEGRRRLAFRPLDAPRGDGVLQGGGRSDRQGQEDRRASCSARRRTGRVRRRPLFVARHQPQLRLPRTRPRSRASTPLPDELKGGVAVVTDNEMHEPVFPERHARSARSRSIPTPARSTSRAMPRSTTSAAASIR